MAQKAETEGEDIATALTRLARRLMVAFVLAAAGASVALATDGGHPPTTAPSAQVTFVERDGFDWADAGIGILGALGVMFVVAGLALAVRYSRRDRFGVATGVSSPGLLGARRRARRKRRLS